MKDKVICSNCGKKYSKEFIISECLGCYQIGAIKEQKKERQRILDLIKIFVDKYGFGENKLREQVKIHLIPKIKQTQNDEETHK